MPVYLFCWDGGGGGGGGGGVGLVIEFNVLSTAQGTSTMKLCHMQMHISKLFSQLLCKPSRIEYTKSIPTQKDGGGGGRETQTVRYRDQSYSTKRTECFLFRLYTFNYVSSCMSALSFVYICMLTAF